jgi:hypothetical protein
VQNSTPCGSGGSMAPISSNGIVPSVETAANCRPTFGLRSGPISGNSQLCRDKQTPRLVVTASLPRKGYVGRWQAKCVD